MKSPIFFRLSRLARESFSALLAISATVFILLLVRRDVVGEGVIALILLMPVVWAAYRWGLAAGMSAALSAALMFNFFFIPPFYTFTIARPEGILILMIFFAVAIIVVERIQSTLSRAQTSEQEAVTMYEFSTLLAGLRSREAIARSVARFLRQRFMADNVTVSIQFKNQAEATVAHEPQDKVSASGPDRILPILSSWGLIGEIRIWSGAEIELPASESRLSRNIALQVGLAVERVQITEYEFQNIVLRADVTK